MSNKIEITSRARAYTSIDDADGHYRGRIRDFPGQYWAASSIAVKDDCDTYNCPIPPAHCPKYTKLIEIEAAESNREPTVHPVRYEWWVAAALIFGFLESLAVALAITTAGQGAGIFMPVTIGTFWIYVIIKTLIFAALFWFAWVYLPSHTWIIAAALCAVGGLLALVNLVIYFRSL